MVPLSLGLGLSLRAAGGSSALNAASVASYGDSITATSYVEAGTTELHHIYLNSYMAWARAILNNRFELLQRADGLAKSDFGYSGARIQDLANGATYETVQPMAVLLARSPKVVVELTGTNNVNGYFGVVAADVAALRVANWDYMLANGVQRIIGVAIPPMDANNIGVEQTGLIDAVNALLAAAASSRAVTWVPYPAVMKSAGKADANYFRDGIHPNNSGAMVMGQAIADALSPYVSSNAFSIPADGAAAWLTGNPYMTGGTTIATGWHSWFGMTGITASKVTDSEGVWQRIVTTTATENATGADSSLIWKCVNETAGLAAGTKIRAVARIRASGLKGVMFRAMLNGDNRGAGYRLYSGFGATGSNPLEIPDNTLTWVGPVITVGSGSPTANIWIEPLGNGTLDIRAAGVIQVP
jgi:hypothetical protein